MKAGNRALADHRKLGRAVRLFDGANGVVTYVGQFEVHSSWPHYTRDAPDVNGEMRKVIVFRLRPIGTVKSERLPQASEEVKAPGSEPDCQTVDIENSVKETFSVSGISERTAERREAALVHEYVEFRARSGLPRLARLKIKPAGEAQPLYSDAYDPAAKIIIEAKGTVTREAIRMAIGQLFDYRRFVDTTHRLAILVPEVPRPDLLQLIMTSGIGVIARDGADAFVERWTLGQDEEKRASAGRAHASGSVVTLATNGAE